MAQQTEGPANRLERRKARTRAALIHAAQGFIANGRLDAAIADITQAADVGTGSFYNHFESKDELFQAAVADALDAYGAVLDKLTSDLDDPAEVFAQAFRIVGRLHRREPNLSKVLLNNALTLAISDSGVAPRVRRDIDDAIRAGRFTAVRDATIAATIVAGATICLGNLLHSEPARDDARAADQAAEDLLRMFGVPADEAHEICRRPLPSTEGLLSRDPAA